MITTTAFSPTYADARARLLSAARAHGLRVLSFTHPTRTGPDGEALVTDVVNVSQPGAERALVLVCGTHGVEGFAGSAIQLDRLERLLRLTGDGTSVVLVHALNPYGFAYLRRVNEDNIDLNRNFIDHASPPHRPDYELVHSALVPVDWQGAAREAADAALAALVGQRGQRFVQAAITGGQWRHPDGLFYGGQAPAWSNRIWRRIVAGLLHGHRHIAYIDIHTGLGEWGRGEPIFRGGRDRAALDRARLWYGGDLTRSEDGTSSSTPIAGNTASVLADLPGDSLVTAITLELGTRPGLFVLSALRADNWRGIHGEADGPASAEITDQMIEAFCPRDEKWQAAVLAEGEVFVERAIEGVLRS